MHYLEFATASNFSFLRGASHPEELMVQAAHIGLTGIGLCDRNSVAGVVRAHLAKREQNLSLRFHPGARLVFADGTPDILAYPRDRAGWGRLTRLLTLGNLRAKKGECILTLDDLLARVDGLELVVMEKSSSPLPLAGEVDRQRRSGGGSNAEQAPSPSLTLPRKRGREQAVQEERTALLRKLCAVVPGRVRLAASMLYRGRDRARLARLMVLAREADVPLIAVNDVHFHHPDRRRIADVLTCIREKITIDQAGRRLAVNAERYLKPPQEMARLFRDAPVTIEETLRLSESLSFSLDELRYEYPNEQVEGFGNAQDALAYLTYEGAMQRYPRGMPDKVRASIEHELALIAQLEYAPYFLTVYDIVRFARSQGILCQGRGSAANSAVCFCLGITEVDPDRADLLFERFISPERREPPDIDVDFEHERREEVIQYIYRKYGRERAGIASTVISYRGRSAIREVGKAFGLSEDTIGALSSSIWGGSGAASKDGVIRAGLDPQSPRMRQIATLAAEINGFPRHLSQHVGGFVITRSRLDEVMPIGNAATEDRTFVEWDKDDLDALGILKIDVLGLGMLSCLRKALDLVEKHYPEAVLLSLPPPERGRSDREAIRVGVGALEKGDPHPDPPPLRGREQAAASGEKLAQHFTLAAIPAEDPAVYRMLQRADSLGVFQVESRAQMTMLPRLKPASFYDLVIEVAIVRPGPIQGDMVHPYLRRRRGQEPVSYPSKELEAVLAKTLGVPLFQEQAMKIAIVAAGFTPSEADKLRRAMATFKRVGTIATFKRKLIDGMLANGYERDFAERCFQQIEGFGEYGFPESHAASFALLVYASAWLKCRYPDVFAAALLNAQPMGFYAPAQIVRDAREHGVEVRPPDVNHSQWEATLEPGPRAADHLHDLHRTMRADIRATHALRLGLREIKGLAEEDARLIVEKRGAAPLPPHSPSSPRPLAGEAGSRSDPGGGSSSNAEQISAPSPIPAPTPTLPRAELGFTRVRPFQVAEVGYIRLQLRGREQVVPCGENETLYDSIRDVWLRTGLSPRVLERLAEADAFNSLGLTRREALWAVKALGRVGDREDDLPLFSEQAANTPAILVPQEAEVHLPAMPLGEEVVNDYRFLHLSLRAHPAQFLRKQLNQRGILPNEALRSLAQNTRVRISGLVTCRQRPGSANGVIFMTIEDESAVANVIVWANVFERFRPVVLGARYVAVSGRVQEESGVIHVVAETLEDMTPLLAQMADRAADFDVTAHGSAHAPPRKAQ